MTLRVPAELTDAELEAELAALDVDETAVVESSAAGLEWLDQVRRQFPLAVSTLWTAEDAACDQRRSVAALMRAPVVGVCLGGERSGKSIGGKQLIVAEAMGSAHPAVRAWLEVNDLPRDIIPPHPAEVYAVSLRTTDSVRYHRPDFEKLVGKGARTWYNMRGKGEAVLYIDCPGYDYPGTIWFKSIDQGVDSFQGISLRSAWVDEEPRDEEGRAVYRQLKARVADQNGRIYLTYAPVHGITWCYEAFVRDREDDAVVVKLDVMDNPHLPRERFERHFKGMSGDELAMRRFGDYRAIEGAVYPMWNPGDLTCDGPGHVCEPFEIPPEWPRFRGADFGLDNPTCVLWGALGDDDTLYIYREMYEAGPTYREHAIRGRELEGWVYDAATETFIPDPRGRPSTLNPEVRIAGPPEAIEASWGDPSAKEAIDLWNSMDFEFDRADNAVKPGIDCVRDRLRLRDDARPRLKVFSTCKNLNREMQGYVWDSKRKDEAPLKKHDHAPDTLRYLCVGIEEWRGL